MRAQRALSDTVGEEAAGRPANEEPVLKHDRCFLTSRKYPRPIRTYVAVGLLVAVSAAASGCGGSEQRAEGPAAGANTPSTTTTTAGGIDELKGAGMGPVVGQTQAKNVALLERIGIGRHEGYDRVVFEFRGDLPGYRVEYVEPPLKEDGSGNPVEVGGAGIVLVRMEPASGFDLNTGEGVIVYKGPKRIEGSDAGASTVREVVRTGDFEAVLSWAIGLEEKVDFRVTTATSPARLIVDFRNH